MSHSYMYIYILYGIYNYMLRLHILINFYHMLQLLNLKLKQGYYYYRNESTRLVWVSISQQSLQ